jgi:hypothetical protein
MNSTALGEFLEGKLRCTGRRTSRGKHGVGAADWELYRARFTKRSGPSSNNKSAPTNRICNMRVSKKSAAIYQSDHGHGCPKSGPNDVEFAPLPASQNQTGATSSPLPAYAIAFQSSRNCRATISSNAGLPHGNPMAAANRVSPATAASEIVAS